MLSERHQPYRVPDAEVRRRIESLQAHMREAGLALAWVDHLADRLYFTGSAQDGVLIVPASGEAVFHVRKSVSRAEGESPLRVAAHPGRRRFFETLRALGLGEGRVGLALDVTPAATWLGLRDSVPGVSIDDLAPIVRAIRAIKSPWEIEQLRGAARQIEILFAEIADHVRPGMTEIELNGRVEGRLRALGHGGTVRVRRPAADIAIGVVVGGSSSRYPTSFDGPVGAEGPYPPTPSGGGWRPLAAGETLMFDIVTSFNGYHVDTTRTFFLGGQVPPEVEHAHAFCIEVRRRIEERLRPGAVCADIYNEVAAFAREAGEPPGFMGADENRVRFFGHGVGLELDELPVIADRVTMTLEPGMVVAVEPKAFLDPWGPVGIEDTHVITDAGPTALCGAPLEIRTIP